MKYVIASALAFALCIAAGLLVTKRISAKIELKLIHKIMITAAVFTNTGMTSERTM